ncbi:MAG: hypothetical protein HY901_23955 [Deltaproteobacteria bacterium]|nr:hypothetical protein [Deltaproteobacteria bacterium]
MPSRSPPLPGLALLACLAAGACGYSLEQGEWTLSRDPQVAAQDTCGLLPADGAVLSGRLVRMGAELRFSAELEPLQTLPMFGRFKHSVAGEPEQFMLEGSVQDEDIVFNGAQCRIRFGQVELHATVLDERTFEGLVTQRYEFNLNQGAGCPERCDVAVGYRAGWMGP